MAKTQDNLNRSGDTPRPISFNKEFGKPINSTDKTDTLFINEFEKPFKERMREKISNLQELKGWNLDKLL